jgi:mono/diheme cytochrome c family protein
MRIIMNRASIIAAAVTALAMVGAVQLRAQDARRPRGLSPVIESLAGRDSYEFYCAACHGSGGRGDGPVSSSLKTRVADLTSLARQSGGTYPLDKVRASIVNRERPITAHGTGEMPVWGYIFGVLDREEVRANVRIDNLVTYIATLQEPPVVSVASGRQLFMAHCARCHGPDGRGGGALAAELRHEVPDLALFAVRNGGVFPSMRVHRIIDGRGIASHGSTEMPIWGEAFRLVRGHPDEAGVAARIEAVTMFLESIQLRHGE